MKPVIAKTIVDIRRFVEQAKKQGKRIGFVPTMGALHKGHASLIEAAARETDYVVVSIFVNPMQFGASEDLERYPRRFEADIELCERCGVAAIFAPSVEEMYPEEQLTWISIVKLSGALCGVHRPGHFQGVATVCMKLFNILQPDIAFFGRKDAQQSVIVRRMVTGLNLPLQIKVCPTVREDDGLAVSSRNEYLSKKDRHAAPAIFKALKHAADLIRKGMQDRETLIDEMYTVLEKAKRFDIEYIDIVDAETLEPIKSVKEQAFIAVAAYLDKTRLIDNILVDATSEPIIIHY